MRSVHLCSPLLRHQLLLARERFCLGGLVFAIISNVSLMVLSRAPGCAPNRALSRAPGRSGHGSGHGSEYTLVAI